MATLILANSGLEAKPVTLDVFTDALIGMDNDHSYIHQGKMFSAFHKASVAPGQTLLFSFKTNSEKFIHYRLAGITPSADKVDTQIFEGATLTAATGTILQANNRNRNSLIVSDVELRVAPTFSANGTLLPGFSFYLPGSTGVGQARVGTNGQSDSEIIFKKNTVYRFVLTNGSDQTNVIGINFRWYEENGGE